MYRIDKGHLNWQILTMVNFHNLNSNSYPYPNLNPNSNPNLNPTLNENHKP